MNIDRIVESVADTAKKGNYKALSDQKGADLMNTPLAELCALRILGDEVKTELYKRFKADAEDYIETYTSSPNCKDPQASKGMFKCSHETFQACIREFGIDYFKKYRYLHDIYRERTEGGERLRDELMYIALESFESICNEYRKVFQITDCCYFMGLSKDNIYKLNDLHGIFLKKTHTAAESSLRIGALTGRGNVTGHAIILNHDYDYTRTTQIIHTSDQAKSASALPQLGQAQDIVLLEDKQTAGEIIENL